MSICPPDTLKDRRGALLRSIIRAAAALLIALLGGHSAAAQTDSAAWLPWDTLDLGSLSNDNSGAAFAWSATVITPDGSAALQVTPGGTADETKLALPVSGADLAAWTDAAALRLAVLLPETNTRNATQFFMGMGDVTGAWRWVDGVFGVVDGDSGWITVRYTPSAAMRGVDPAGAYMLYLAFFNDVGGKPPLTEPFYLGAMTLDPPTGVSLAGDETRFQAEAEALLALDDAALIAAVARETFAYFWDEADPDTGLIRDRSTAASPSSIAAVGFGLTALTIGAERGWIAPEQAYERARLTLTTFASGGVAGERGFFYHFVDLATGERVWDSELSSIDTALFIAGALTVGAYFPDTEVAQLAQQLYEAVDWVWMMNERPFVTMGWRPADGFLAAMWDHFDESLILYALAIGSPTYPVPPETWARWRRPVDRAGEFIYLPGEPLFVYQYPLAWLDLRDREDAFAHYVNNTTRACERQQAFARDHAEAFPTYRGGVWGISASDGPNGYRAYGAAFGNHDGTVAPYASIACLPFTPAAALDSMRALLTQHGSRVWREYGFVSGINVGADWYSTEHIGIDQGAILLMIANHQDGFVWDLLAEQPAIVRALTAMGFVDSTGDYAVTPAYLARVRGG